MVKCHIKSCQRCILLTCPAIVDVSFDHLAEVLFVRFLHCGYSFSPFSYCPLWKEAPCAAVLKKGGVIPHLLKNAAAWLDPEVSILSEVKARQRDKHHVTSLTCGISKTVPMNLSTKQKQSHRQRKQTHGFQRGEGWGGVN